MTAPPEKAILNALGKPLMAPQLVLAFDFVAIIMPKKPARDEKTAPAMKEIAQIQLRKMNIKSAITKIIGKKIAYS